MGNFVLNGITAFLSFLYYFTTITISPINWKKITETPSTTRNSPRPYMEMENLGTGNEAQQGSTSIGCQQGSYGTVQRPGPTEESNGTAHNSGTTQGKYETAQSCFVNIEGGYGTAQSSGTTQGGYGTAQSSGTTQGTYGTAQSCFINIEGGYETAQSRSGSTQSSYGTAQGYEYSSDSDDGNGTLVVTNADIHWVGDNNTSSSEASGLSLNRTLRPSNARAPVMGNLEDGFEEIDLNSNSDRWDSSSNGGTVYNHKMSASSDEDSEQYVNARVLRNRDQAPEVKVNRHFFINTELQQEGSVSSSSDPTFDSFDSAPTQVPNHPRSVTFDPQVQQKEEEKVYDEVAAAIEEETSCWSLCKKKKNNNIEKQPSGKNQQVINNAEEGNEAGQSKSSCFNCCKGNKTVVVEQPRRAPPAALRWENRKPFHVEMYEREEWQAREREEWRRRKYCDRACLYIVGAWAFLFD